MKFSNTDLKEEVVVVDELDREQGTMNKIDAHFEGVRHRAFSVLLFNGKGDFLIQKRANNKYHSGGLWSNTCCSHPRPQEPIEAAGKRRLKEEVGIDAEVQSFFHFEYRAELDNNLIEHELDHVLMGRSESSGIVNPDECSELKFIPEKELLSDMKARPENYTAWFKILMFEHLEKIKAFNQ